MVSKKRNPPPPSPTNSSEVEEEEVEEEIEEEEEEEEVKKDEEEGHEDDEETEGESDEGESDEDENQSTSHPVQPSSHDGKKPSTATQRQTTPPPAEVPNSGSDEEAETEAEEEDEEEDPGLTNEESESSPITASAYTVKPIALPENTKGSKATPKRSLESSKEDDVKGSGNRKRAKTGERNDKKGKGASFTRIWSEANEIVVLEGMVNFQKQNGPYRSSDLGIFHEFIKGKLWEGVTKNQIGDKLKRLKGKYLGNVRKSKNGQDPTFSKLHEKKAFELSKQVWGGGIESNVVEEKPKPQPKPQVDNGKGKKVSNALIESSNGVEEKTKTKLDNGKGKIVSSAGNENKRVEDNKRVINEEAKQNSGKDDELMNDDKQNFVSKFPTLCMSFDAEAGFLKKNLHLIGNQKARELEEEWKQLQLEEMNLLAKRLNMKSELINLVLDAMKKQ